MLIYWILINLFNLIRSFFYDLILLFLIGNFEMSLRQRTMESFQKLVLLSHTILHSLFVDHIWWDKVLIAINVWAYFIFLGHLRAVIALFFLSASYWYNCAIIITVRFIPLSAVWCIHLDLLHIIISFTDLLSIWKISTYAGWLYLVLFLNISILLRNKVFSLLRRYIWSILLLN